MFVDFPFLPKVHILCSKKHHRLTMPNPPLHPDNKFGKWHPLVHSRGVLEKMNQAKNKTTGDNQKLIYVIYIYQLYIRKDKYTMSIKTILYPQVVFAAVSARISRILLRFVQVKLICHFFER